MVGVDPEVEIQVLPACDDPREMRELISVCLARRGYRMIVGFPEHGFPGSPLPEVDLSNTGAGGSTPRVLVGSDAPDRGPVDALEGLPMLRKTVRWACIGVVILLLGIQVVPYGRNHTNPPVGKEPPWASPQARALAVRACYDCHSNETVWPWYSNIAPVSWLLQYDVDEGRRKLNFSEWDRPQRKAREAAKKVREWEMPPPYYAAFHPKAWLMGAKRAGLVQGLEATLGGPSQKRHAVHEHPGNPGA
jgi:hypothetical protein